MRLSQLDRNKRTKAVGGLTALKVALIKTPSGFAAGQVFYSVLAHTKKWPRRQTVRFKMIY